MINIFFLFMVVAELIAASSQMLLKKSAQKEHSSIITEYLNPWVICGYGLLLLSMIVTIFCYDGLGYMGVVVMEPINYVIVLVMARLFFKEKITLRKLMGVILIISGIVVFYVLG